MPGLEELHHLPGDLSPLYIKYPLLIFGYPRQVVRRPGIC